MEKKEKNIHIVIIIVLVAIIASGVTYVLTKNKYYNNQPDSSLIENDVEEKDNQEINAKYIKGKEGKKYFLKLDEEKQELVIYNENLDVIDTNIKMYNCNNEIEHTGFSYLYDFGVVELENNDIWYDNDLNIDVENNIYGDKLPISVKVENDKIYFLMPKLNYVKLEGAYDESAIEIDSKDYGSLEERIYTINNNKLEYVVNGTYKIKSISQTC